MKFDLSPLETENPDDAARCGEVEATIRAPFLGEERELWLRCVDFRKRKVIFVREAGRDENWNFVWLWRCAEPLTCQTLPVARKFRKKWREASWGRWFWVQSKPFSGRLLLGSDGVGWFETQDWEKVYFRWAEIVNQSKFASWSLPELGTMFDKWAHDETSEVHFALNWTRLSDDERYERGLHMKNGDSNDLRHVMQWILQSDGDIWRASTALTWSLNRSFDEGMLYYAKGWALKKDSPPRLHNWRTLLCEHFQPSPNREFIEKHLTVQTSWYERGELFSVTVEKPTAHEQLEATVKLRAWLQTRFGAAIPPGLF